LIAFQGRLPPYYGGGARQVLAILNRLIRRAPRLVADMYVINPNDTKVINQVMGGIRVNAPYKKDAGFLGYMELLLKSIGPIAKASLVWIGVSTYRGLVVALIAKCLGRRILLRTSLWGYDDPDSILKTFRLNSGRLFLSMADVIVCNSKLTEQRFSAHGFKDKVRYVPNGVDADFYKPVGVKERKHLRPRYGIPVDRTVLLYTGAFSRRKNILFLFDVLRILNDGKHRHLLFLLGPRKRTEYVALDDDYVNEMDHIIHAYGLEKNIIFDSFQDPNSHVYQLADIYVSASLAEGMPNSMLEAMACGLPVVALDLDGNLKTLVHTGENGFRIEELNPDAFARSILKIVGDSDLKKRFGRQSRKIIEENHRLTDSADAYHRIIKGLAPGL
jgi:glycosyltransferase involved in cell wall biosynthesis